MANLRIDEMLNNNPGLRWDLRQYAFSPHPLYLYTDNKIVVDVYDDYESFYNDLFHQTPSNFQYIRIESLINFRINEIHSILVKECEHYIGIGKSIRFFFDAEKLYECLISLRRIPIKIDDFHIKNVEFVLVERPKPLSKEYQLYHDIYISANVGGDNRAYLEMYKKDGNININTTRLSCIHTGITTTLEELGVDDLEELEDKKETLYNAVTSEGKQIDLNREEKFNALVSWLEGIVEFGADAVIFQKELDTYLNNMYPISSFLLKGLVQNDSTFIPIFLESVIKECRYDNQPHIPSLTANLEMFCKIDKTYYRKYVEMLDIPDEVKENLHQYHELQGLFDRNFEIIDSHLIDENNQSSLLESLNRMVTRGIETLREESQVYVDTSFNQLFGDQSPLIGRNPYAIRIDDDYESIIETLTSNGYELVDGNTTRFEIRKKEAKKQIEAKKKQTITKRRKRY